MNTSSPKMQGTCDNELSQVDHSFRQLEMQSAHLCELCDEMISRIEPVLVIEPPANQMAMPDKSITGKNPEPLCPIAFKLLELRDTIELKTVKMSAAIERIRV